MTAPTIFINDLPLDVGVSNATQQQIARSGVRIQWGRASLFDRPSASTATFEVITRGLNPTPIRKGDAVRITHPTLTVFRGVIADAPSRTRTVSYANGLRESVTVTNVTAQDVMVRFAQWIPIGPSTGNGAVGGSLGSEGRGGFWTELTTDRIIRLLKDNVSQWAWPGANVGQNPLIQSWSSPNGPDDTSALEYLYQAYGAAGALASMTYDPHWDLFTWVAQPGEDKAVITLTPVSGTGLKITLPADVRTLPAGRVRLEDTELGAPAEDISVVRIEVAESKQEQGAAFARIDKGVFQAAVPGASPAGRTWTCPFRPYIVSIAGSTWTGNGYPDWWLTQAARVMAAMNGMRSLPPLIIDPEDPNLPAGVTKFNTADRTPGAHYLADSQYAGIPGAPSVVSFIGGTLTYTEKGWRHALTAAPTEGGAPPTLALDDLFPASSTDRLDAWDPTLTINDLAAVTRRA